MTIASRPARQYGTLEEATARLIKACGGIDGAAESCRVGRSQLSDYANPNVEDAYMPADVVRQLETACGQPHVTEYLAACHGLVLVRLPNEPVDIGTWNQAEASVLQKHAERSRKMADALADGVFELSEAVEVLRGADEALRETAMQREMLRQYIAEQTASAAAE